jgi:dTDP-glucose 4,6-dehydratase
MNGVCAICLGDCDEMPVGVEAKPLQLRLRAKLLLGHVGCKIIMRVLVTGGCGFIGSAAVRFLVRAGHEVLNIDKLTYAGDLRTVAAVAGSPSYSFKKTDILDQESVAASFKHFAPQAVFHIAAETHVDRSIDNPEKFINSNIHGTFVMLQAALCYWNHVEGQARASFRFIHVSTDEVYGSLGAQGYFTEKSAYSPNSPYSASKAASDHLTRAWFATYGLPSIISHCSNNYGPFQNSEKLIPTIIRNALLNRPIPIYGQGSNVRDWLYVDDHVAALVALCEKGRPGNCYNIGGYSEISNLELARGICAHLDLRSPRSDGRGHAECIQFVADRPGHDYRYAIDASKTTQEVGWQPQENLQSGLSKTVDWYLDHLDWTMHDASCEERLGLGPSSTPTSRG